VLEIKKKTKDELDWKNRSNRFLIAMLNVPSVVVISGAENGKLQRIR